MSEIPDKQNSGHRRQAMSFAAIQGPGDFPTGVVALARALDKGELSALQATEHFLKRIETYDKRLNSFINVTAELALAQARKSDQRRRRGQSLGILDGIAIAVKDNIDVAGVVSTGGLAARRDHVASRDAAVIESLSDAGAVIIGKTNMHEAALGATTDNPAYGKCHNPHRLNYTPGGSSGGSAAAVAAGFCAAALGTDTLGSVRIPAAYCGCYGFKASTGFISNRGVLALSWSLDHVGPLAPVMEDLWPLLSVLMGYDAQCANSRAITADEAIPTVPTIPTIPTLSKPGDLTDLRIACVRHLEDRIELRSDVGQAYLDAQAGLRTENIELIEIDLDFDFQRLRRIGLLISEAEASVVHKRAIEDNPGGYSQELRRMLHWGAAQSAQRLAEAYRDVEDVVCMMRQQFRRFDALLLPTAPQTAFPFTTAAPVNQAELTSLANLARCPAISIPAGYDREGLPVGLQLVGAERQDRKLLRIASTVSNIFGNPQSEY